MRNTSGTVAGLYLFIGIVLALSIIIPGCSLFSSLFKQPSSVQSRINFDLVASYLQQCQQSSQKDCYCDPPLALERASTEETLSLSTHADGVYLELKKDDGQPQRKKVSDKSLCLYSYSLRDKTWSSKPMSSYTFSHGSQWFITYLTSGGDLCFLRDYFSPDGSGITQEAATQLRSCFAQKSSLTLFLSQRHPATTTDTKQTILYGQQFMAALQQTFPSQGSVFVSKIQPLVVQSGSYDGPFTYEDYSRTQNDVERVFSSVASRAQGQYTKSFLLLSPQLALSDQTSPKDLITISYLPDSSASKLLAERLQHSLQQLSDKSYHNALILTPKDATHQQYLLSFDVRVAPLDSQADTLFSQPWIQKNYASFAAQRASIPAVFIDFTDFKNPHNFFEAHSLPFAQALLLGVQDSLQQQPAKTGDIFAQP